MILPEHLGNCTLYLGDCLQVLQQLPENSLDACVTDPPAGIGFMGVGWDTFRGKSGVSRPRYRDGKGECDYIGSKEHARTADQVAKITKKAREAFIPWLTSVMQQVYRVLKPGAHALVWALPRTSHWTAMACEDAGFEVRDSILHIFSSGFPKSQNISKSIDKYFGAEREVVGEKMRGDVEKAKTNGATFAAAAANKNNTSIFGYGIEKITAPATDAAKQYQGWGSALSPSHETWWLCRKPISESTLAKNVLRWGVGGINIDGCRISGEEPHHNYGRTSSSKAFAGASDVPFNTSPLGRWPKNTILDGSETVAAQFTQAPGQQGKVTGNEPTANGFSGAVSFSGMRHRQGSADPRNDTGSAARFFYAAKASADDRGEHNFHPTVKNVNLMRWLIRLVTPPGGTVLDPFMGSGSTGKAAVLEDKAFLGIEQAEEYYAIAKQRLTIETAQTSLFAP